MTQRRHGKNKTTASNNKQEHASGSNSHAATTKATTTTTKSTKSYSCIRNMGLWRFFFFTIMLYHWNTPYTGVPFFGDLDLDMNLKPEQSSGFKPTFGVDRWFRYNNLDWVQDIHAYINHNFDRKMLDSLHHTGTVSCVLAAVGIEFGLPWTVPTLVFTLLNILRFFGTLMAFVNHNYLFLLLMILTLCSGGGDMRHGTTFLQSNKNKCDNTDKAELERKKRKSEVFCVLLRAQFMVLYGFATLWKLQSDWISGGTTKAILLNFEAQHAARGVPWSKIGVYFPQVFQVVAVGGLLLDGAMFLSFLCVKPTAFGNRLFVAMTCLFHSFTAYTMSQVIGYTFPSTCFAAILVFLPMTINVTLEIKPEDHDFDDNTFQKHVDASLLEWFRRYYKGSWPPDVSRPTSSQRLFFISWMIIQLIIPLRTPIISGGKFPYTMQGYRFSWTMMLHSQRRRIHHPMKMPDGSIESFLLELSYLSPTCFDAKPDFGEPYIPRSVYAPRSEEIYEDDRTIPFNRIIRNPSYRSTAQMYPNSLLPQVAGGMANLVENLAPPQKLCLSKGAAKPDVGIHASFFHQINGKGPFSRLVDPTVDLVKVDAAQRSRGFWSKMYGAMIDRPPPGFDHMLRHGIGSLRVEAERFEKHMLPVLRNDLTLYFVADRAACLMARPLWIRPVGYPITIIALKVPRGLSMAIKSQETPNSDIPIESVKWDELEVGKRLMVPNATSLRDSAASFQTYSMEIGMEGTRLDGVNHNQLCRDTVEEDVLYAIAI